MAHNVETMAYAGEVPWHGLGKKVPADLTSDQMLQAAGLDWEVVKTPVYYDADVKDGIEIPSQFALHRKYDGQYLDTVGANWRPLQNHQAFEFFNDFIMQGDMEMHTAGSLQNGKIVWALAKMKKSYAVVTDDEMQQYMLFVNPHKRGKAIEVRSTDIRVVCNNTMDFALESTSNKRIAVNHNSAWDEDYVKDMLGLAHSASAKYQETAQFLASKRYTQPTLEEFIDSLFPNTGKSDERSKNAHRTLDLVHEQPGAHFAEGSWWQAFNAVTRMTDHEMGRSADSRLTSAWFGQNRTRKAKALSSAVEYAEAA